MPPNTGKHQVRPLADGDPRRIGRYILDGRLGQGGMGTVYLGHTDDGPLVAVKIIHEELARLPDFRVRLRGEAAAARRVARFCTAEVIDVDPDAEVPYLVTEFVEGPTLEDKIAADGPMGIGDLERLAVAVVAALTAIHGAGLVHRDLKPSNVMLSPLGPRVIDFGIARTLDSSTTLTGVGQVLGTPAFMAPEQATGHSSSPAADIFAWGVLVMYAATGRLPFGEKNGSLLFRVIHGEPDLAGLDPALLAPVSDALHKDPARRPTAHQLFLRLTGVRPGVPADVPDGPEPEADPEALDTGSRDAGDAGKTSGDRPTGVGDAPTEPPAAPNAPTGGAARRRGRAVRAFVGAAVLACCVAALAAFLIRHSNTTAGVSPAPVDPRPAPENLPRSAAALDAHTLVWVGAHNGRHYDLYSGYLTGSRFTEIHQITRGPDQSLLPAIVPGRRTILFFDQEKRQINAVAATGGRVEENVPGKIRGPLVTIDPDARPTVSPDGRFMAVAGAEPGRPGIYVIPLDGSGTPRRLPTGQATVGDPAWSPAGDLIAYWGNTDGGDGGTLYTIDASGLGPPGAVTGGHRDADPAWSPDGRTIVFRRQTGGVRDLDIFHVSSVGGEVTRLTTDSRRYQDPTFSPDGRSIAFTGERAGNRDLYIMNADGSGERELATGMVLNAHPRWESG
jgi:eukaryotic-like serine/threonine-protein kinase